MPAVPEIEGAALVVGGAVEDGTVVGTDGLELTGTVGSPPPQATSIVAAERAQTCRSPRIKHVVDMKPFTKHLSVPSHERARLRRLATANRASTLGFAGSRQSDGCCPKQIRAKHQERLIGDPATLGARTFRPEALRHRLSTGLPFQKASLASSLVARASSSEVWSEGNCSDRNRLWRLSIGEFPAQCLDAPTSAYQSTPMAATHRETVEMPGNSLSLISRAGCLPMQGNVSTVTWSTIKSGLHVCRQRVCKAPD